MSRFYKAISLALCSLVTFACDVSASDPAGKWERQHTNVGESFIEVLELTEQGSYVRHSPGFTADRGHYSYEEGHIIFTSTANRRHSRTEDVVFLGGDTMVLSVQPFGVEETWQRSSRSPSFSTVEIDGREVPDNLADLLKAAYLSASSSWQTDAIPTGIDVEELASGHYRVGLSFFSPTAVRQLRVEFEPYNYAVWDDDGSRALQAPLPADFLELPVIVGIAHEAGYSGALVRADLADYGRFGAVWTGHTGGSDGFQIAAGAGEVVTDDITGYLAQHEADWNAAGEMWRDILERLLIFRQETARAAPIIHMSRESCERDGHSWTGDSPGSCNNVWYY